MNTENKFLKIVFFLLLVVLLGEVGYFFYNSKVVNSIKISDNTGILNNVVTTTPNAGLAADSSQIKYLQELKRFNIDYLKLTYNIGGEGVISNLKFTASGSATFDITDKNNKISTNIKFPINPSVHFSVFQSKSGTLYPIDLKDLVDGNEIKFTWTYDMEMPTGTEDFLYNELVVFN